MIQIHIYSNYPKTPLNATVRLVAAPVIGDTILHEGKAWEVKKRTFISNEQQLSLELMLL